MSKSVPSTDYKTPEDVTSEAAREHQLRREGMTVTMTPELERLLDQGLEDLEHAKTTDELRRQLSVRPTPLQQYLTQYAPRITFWQK